MKCLWSLFVLLYLMARSNTSVRSLFMLGVCVILVSYTMDYYMCEYMGTGLFVMLYLGFLGFMLVLLYCHSYYMFIVGWEMMGVFSLFLISWH